MDLLLVHLSFKNCFIILVVLLTSVFTALNAACKSPQSGYWHLYPAVFEPRHLLLFISFPLVKIQYMTCLSQTKFLIRPG